MKIHCKLTFENLHKFQERGIIFIVLWFVLINYFLFSRTCSVSGATYLLTTASVRWVACLLGIPFFRSKSDKRAPDYNEQIILVPSQHPIIHNNVKLLCYNEHPVTTSTQCTTAVLKCFQEKKTFLPEKIALHIREHTNRIIICQNMRSSQPPTMRTHFRFSLLVFLFSRAVSWERSYLSFQCS